jgi:hypothetical protein
MRAIAIEYAMSFDVTPAGVSCATMPGCVTASDRYSLMNTYTGAGTFDFSGQCNISDDRSHAREQCVSGQIRVCSTQRGDSSERIMYVHEQHHNGDTILIRILRSLHLFIAGFLSRRGLRDFSALRELCAALDLQRLSQEVGCSIDGLKHVRKPRFRARVVHIGAGHPQEPGDWSPTRHERTAFR